MVEIVEITNTAGSDAAVARSTQMLRNQRRRQQRADRKRYAAIARDRNLQIAAEKLVAEKLAAEKAAAQKAQPTATQPVADQKKPPAPVAKGSAPPTEAKKTA